MSLSRQEKDEKSNSCKVSRKSHYVQVSINSCVQNFRVHRKFGLANFRGPTPTVKLHKIKLAQKFQEVYTVYTYMYYNLWKVVSIIISKHVQ